MYSTICVEWAADHWSWFAVNPSIFDEDTREKRFLRFRYSDFDLSPLDLKFAPPVKLVQRYVSTKL